MSRNSRVSSKTAAPRMPVPVGIYNKPNAKERERTPPESYIENVIHIPMKVSNLGSSALNKHTSSKTNKKPAHKSAGRAGPSDDRWKSTFRPADKNSSSPSRDVTSQASSSEKGDLYDPYDPVSSESEPEALSPRGRRAADYRLQLPAQRGHDPAHRGHDPAHRGHDPAQRGHDPAHRGHDPAQRGHDPAHRGHDPAHRGHDPAHRGHDPAHRGHDPAQRGHDPAHRGHNLAQLGHEPAHQGHDPAYRGHGQTPRGLERFSPDRGHRWAEPYSQPQPMPLGSGRHGDPDPCPADARRSGDRRSYSPDGGRLELPGYAPGDGRCPSPGPLFTPTEYGQTNGEEGARRETTTTMRLSPPRFQLDYIYQSGYVHKGSNQIPPSEVTRHRSRSPLRETEKSPFTCELCEVELAKMEDFEEHLESKAHWDVLEHVQRQNNYDDLAIAFLQEVLLFKIKQCSQAMAKSAIKALQEEEHMTMVELVHCAACEVNISSSVSAVQHHLTSQEHDRNKKEFGDRQRRTSLVRAETMMQELKPQFEHFLKGGDPFL